MQNEGNQNIVYCSNKTSNFTSQIKFYIKIVYMYEKKNKLYDSLVFLLHYIHYKNTFQN